VIALGAWVDSRKEDVLQPFWWSRFREYGFSTASIMVETTRAGLDEKWKDHELAQAGILARAADVELVLCFWPEPDTEYLAELERRAPALCDLSGAAAVDLDAEGNWVRSKLKGFVNLEAAAVALEGLVRRWARTRDIRLELSTYPFHSENSYKAVLAPRVDRIYPQAYSVAKRKDGTGIEAAVPWDDRFGPGQMQHLTLERAKQVPGVGMPAGPVVCIGLAAYDQRFAGHSPEEAMEVAYETAKGYNPLEVRYWSTKHIWGPAANPYAAEFFKKRSQS
jgi:hypothetical protein